VRVFDLYARQLDLYLKPNKQATGHSEQGRDGARLCCYAMQVLKHVRAFFVRLGCGLWW